MPSWAVVGIGSLLRSDDGIGPRLIAEIGEEIENLGGEAIDAGTGGYALTDLMCRYDRLLFLDAAGVGEAPGAVRLIGREEIAALDLGAGPGLSGHEADLPASIRFAEQVRRIEERTEPLDVAVVGIRPASMEMGLELSEPVAARWKEVVQTVRRLIHEWIEAAGA